MIIMCRLINVNELGYVIMIILIEILIFSLYLYGLLFSLLEIVHSINLLLFSFIGLILELLHKFHLIRESFSPELLSFIKFNLPI